MPIIEEKSNKLQSIKRGLLRSFPLVKRFWWWGHVKLPQLVPTPSLYPYHRNPERDQRKNEETKLPPDEDASVLAIWATEAYGPAEIEVLYAGLEALNWDQNRLHNDHSGSVNWIKRQRQVGTEGTFNLNIVQRIGEPKYIPHDFFAELPPGVEYLIVKIHQVCPSLTCLQVVFVLDQAQQRVYAKQLQLDRTTIHEPIKGRFNSYRIADPWHLKQRAIESQRKEFQTLATLWFQRHFPGVFCATPTASLPTAELITTRHATLFEDTKRASSSLNSWSRLVANCQPYSAWKSTEHHSFMFATQDTTNEDLPHIVITLSADDIAEDAVKHYGGREHEAFVAFVQDHLDSILVRFAVIALLNSFRRILMQTRDKLRTASPSKRSVLKSLDYIQNFFSASLQVPSIVGEIEGVTKDTRSYKWACDGFVEATPFRDESPASLYERLSAHTNSLANRLLQDDRTTRDVFKQLSEVVTARESVKAQRRIELLTVVTIAFAALSLWIALPPIKEWRAKLPEWVQQNLDSTEHMHQVKLPVASSS